MFQYFWSLSTIVNHHLRLVNLHPYDWFLTIMLELMPHEVCTRSRQAVRWRWTNCWHESWHSQKGGLCGKTRGPSGTIPYDGSEPSKKGVVPNSSARQGDGFTATGALDKQIDKQIAVGQLLVRHLKAQDSNLEKFRRYIWTDSPPSTRLSGNQLLGLRVVTNKWWDRPCARMSVLSVLLL